MRGMARTAAVVGTASAVRGNVGRRQQKRWSEDDAQQQAQAAPVQEVPAQAAPVQAAPVAAAAPAQDDTVAQLEQLAKLKDQGILTEEEFTAKKAQILGL